MKLLLKEVKFEQNTQATVNFNYKKNVIKVSSGILPVLLNKT